MGPKECQVCNGALSKYKCPSCLTPYCSLVCFKKHKETPCLKPASTEEKSAAAPQLPVERPLSVDEPSEVLQQLQLQSIGGPKFNSPTLLLCGGASSAEIRSALKDESLQKLILCIDSSSDPESELDKAMGVEEFRIFTDKIFSAMG